MAVAVAEGRRGFGRADAEAGFAVVVLHSRRPPVPDRHARRLKLSRLSARVIGARPVVRAGAVTWGDVLDVGTPGPHSCLRAVAVAEARSVVVAAETITGLAVVTSAVAAVAVSRLRPAA